MAESLTGRFAGGFPHKLSDNLPKLDLTGLVDGEVFDSRLPLEASNGPERKPYLVEVVGFHLTFYFPHDGVVAYRRIIEAGVILRMLDGQDPSLFHGDVPHSFARRVEDVFLFVRQS